MTKYSRIIILAFASVITLSPFALLALGAMSTDSQIARLDFADLKLANLLTNFEVVFKAGFAQSLLNSLFICLAMMLIQVASSVLAAFAFAFLQFRFKRIGFALLIGGYLIPAVATVLPLFFVLTSLGLKGTPLGILLPFVLYSPYALVLLRQRFEAIPAELMDQARIDGLGNWSLLSKIVAPLNRSFIALIAVITFVANWNSYLWPRLIAGGDWPTVNVFIASLQSQYDSHWNLILAATLIALVPAFAIFAFAKKSLVFSSLEEIET